MKLSWSHKLFLNINKQIGAKPWRDRIMHVCGHELISILGFVVVIWATSELYGRDAALLNQWLKLLLTAGLSGLIISWFIAFLFPHRRPIKEIPTIVQLINPIGTWKSFPSDHTILSFVLAGITISMGVSWWFGMILILLASLVAIGRVYVGVHYPRDIMGGLAVAAIVLLCSRWLLTHVTQPLYDLFITLF